MKKFAAAHPPPWVATLLGIGRPDPEPPRRPPAAAAAAVPFSRIDLRGRR
ncbi:MAG TPA: hypothetical protein VKQ32_03945 [Polyangia bacterium]|nr:hypothetical protein [Polyangia bacterium]